MTPTQQPFSRDKVGKGRESDLCTPCKCAKSFSLPEQELINLNGKYLYNMPIRVMAALQQVNTNQNAHLAFNKAIGSAAANICKSQAGSLLPSSYLKVNETKQFDEPDQATACFVDLLIRAQKLAAIQVPQPIKHRPR